MLNIIFWSNYEILNKNMWGVTCTAVRVGNLPDKSIYWNEKSVFKSMSICEHLLSSDQLKQGWIGKVLSVSLFEFLCFYTCTISFSTMYTYNITLSLSANICCIYYLLQLLNILWDPFGFRIGPIWFFGTCFSKKSSCLRT